MQYWTNITVCDHPKTVHSEIGFLKTDLKFLNEHLSPSLPEYPFRISNTTPTQLTNSICFCFFSYLYKCIIILRLCQLKNLEYFMLFYPLYSNNYQTSFIKKRTVMLLFQCLSSNSYALYFFFYLYYFLLYPAAIMPIGRTFLIIMRLSAQHLQR